MNSKCPKCGKMTVEHYPNDESLGKCLVVGCDYKEKITDRTHCVVCFGEVVENRVSVFSEFAGEEREEIDGYYCVKCGLQYQFKPDYSKIKR